MVSFIIGTRSALLSLVPIKRAACGAEAVAGLPSAILTQSPQLTLQLGSQEAEDRMEPSVWLEPLSSTGLSPGTPTQSPDSNSNQE